MRDLQRLSPSEMIDFKPGVHRYPAIIPPEQVMRKVIIDLAGDTVEELQADYDGWWDKIPSPSITNSRQNHSVEFSKIAWYVS